MSEIIKQSMANIWASIGDVVAPDVVKIAEGWSVEVVPRQYWNWMQNRTDTNLAYLFQHGIPEWDATVEYIVNKSYVTYADVVYKAILTGTNKIPSSQPTYWKVAFATSTAALEALKATTPAADELPYFSGTTTATTTTLTPLARSLLDDTTQAAMLTTIGAQPVDATLTALAGVTTSTNKLPYFSGVDTATVTDLSAFGRSLIDDVDATAARTTIGLNNVNNTSDATKPVSAAQQAALDLKAPLLSPALTGVPTAPTATVGTSTTQIASTAFVNAEIAADRPYSVTTTDIKMDGVQSLGVLATIPRADHVHPSDTSKLSLSGGTLTGPIDFNRFGAIASGLSWYSPSHDTWQEYMAVAGVASQGVRGNVTPPVGSLVSSWGRRSYIENLDGYGWVFESAANGSTTPTIMMELSSATGAAKFTGAITAPTFNGALAGNASSASTLSGLTSSVAELNYVAGVTSSIQTQLNAKAPLASPALSGTPTAPTATLGTNTTQLATTAFVLANGGGIGAGQTWQDVTGSRGASTNYTNTTGKPIGVSVSFSYVGQGASYIVVDGVMVNSFTYSLGGTGATMSAIVPNGSVYSAGGAKVRWTELR